MRDNLLPKVQMVIWLRPSLLVLLVLFTSGCLNEEDPTASLHEDITVTVFWIGEEGSEENEFIPNDQSVWDDRWLDHFGGVDDPVKRNGSLPMNFNPLENPFYFALPYNDFDESGIRRSEAAKTIPWSDERTWNESESMCKNRWIEIVKGENAAYAQWEDSGPFGEDDASYVFGRSKPKNDLNDHAGLDVSPAVRDYLNLDDIDTVDWRFLDPGEVPEGPWKEIVTDSQVCWE
jgi:hypothetical protein